MGATVRLFPRGWQASVTRHPKLAAALIDLPTNVASLSKNASACTNRALTPFISDETGFPMPDDARPPLTPPPPTGRPEDFDSMGPETFDSPHDQFRDLRNRCPV